MNQKQLTAWNKHKIKLGGVSANENVNISRGLPSPQERKLLSKVHDANFGCVYPAGKVTMRMVREYVGIHGEQ